jgi:predicted RNA-binding protein
LCEFKVILNGEEVFKDVVYAKAVNGKVTVRDVLGQSKEFENAKIIEVDIDAARLVLAH